MRTGPSSSNPGCTITTATTVITEGRRVHLTYVRRSCKRLTAAFDVLASKPGKCRQVRRPQTSGRTGALPLLLSERVDPVTGAKEGIHHRAQGCPEPDRPETIPPRRRRAERVDP